MSEEYDEEIQRLSQNLIVNLKLAKPKKNDFLCTDEFYIEVCKCLLDKAGSPFDRSKFEKETKNYSSGDRIQALINKLAGEVLQVDLNHIKGDKIAKGNKKNISDMLQLLDALWHNLNQDGDIMEDDGEEEQMIEHIDSDINRHESFTQEQELNRASNSEYLKKEKGGQRAGQQVQNDAMFNKMMQDGKMNHGNIPVYNEDPINYGGIELQPKYSKGQRRQGKTKTIAKQGGPRKMVARPQSANLSSKKYEVVRRIENNVYGMRTDNVSREKKLIKPQVDFVYKGRQS